MLQLDDITGQVVLLASSWQEPLHRAPVGLRELQDRHPVQVHHGPSERWARGGRQPKLGELAANVVFASYDIHFVLKYHDSR